MLKNLASFGAAAGAVQTGASRIILDMRPRTASCPKSFLQTFANVPFTLRNLPADRNNSFGIDNRRHCMGPSVDLFEPETHIRKLRFTGKCPRLTDEKNISNPNIAQSSHFEVRLNRPTSCPQKLSSHIASLKLSPGNSERINSKETLVSSLLKSKLACGYANKATSKRPTAEPHKTFSTSMTSQPASRNAESESMNRYSVQNLSKLKRPLSNLPRMLKVDRSSPYLQKTSLKTTQVDKEKPETKSVNRHFGSQKQVSAFERYFAEKADMAKKPTFAEKGKIAISNTKHIRSADSRILTKPANAKPEIRTSACQICSMSRLQNSSTHVMAPYSQVTNSSNITKRSRMMRPTQSVTSTSNRLWSDQGANKYPRRKLRHPFESESSPDLFNNNPTNKLNTNPEKSDLITLLEPHRTSKSWRGDTKTMSSSRTTEKQNLNNPNADLELESKKINSEGTRPHNSTKGRYIFSRTETHKLHPGTINANRQIAMIYKEKFDPGVLDRFRYRSVIANKYAKPKNNKNLTPQAPSVTQSSSSYARNAPLARKQSFASSAAVKALEVRNNLSFVKKPPTLPGGRRESFVIRPVTTTKHAQSTNGWVPFIRPPLMSSKYKIDKNIQTSESKENIDKLANNFSRRPLRQWKERAVKWTDSSSRRLEREAKGKIEFADSSSMRKAVEKREESPNDASTTDNKGISGSAVGGKEGRRKIPLAGKRSTSHRNVASQVLSSWRSLQSKIHSGYLITLHSATPLLRIPPMLPDHIRFGTPKHD